MRDSELLEVIGCGVWVIAGVLVLFFLVFLAHGCHIPTGN